MPDYITHIVSRLKRSTKKEKRKKEEKQKKKPIAVGYQKLEKAAEFLAASEATKLHSDLAYSRQKKPFKAGRF